MRQKAARESRWVYVVMSYVVCLVRDVVMCMVRDDGCSSCEDAPMLEMRAWKSRVSWR